MKRIAAILFALALLSLSLFAQDDTISNADVVALHKSGLNAEVIIAKIKAAGDVNFDTSTAGLVELGNAGVPSDVVALMVKRAGAAKENAADVPEQGTLSELKGLKTFYVVTNDMKARDRIATEVGKAGYTMADKIESCDFFLYYQEWTEPVRGSAYENKVGILTVARRLPRDRRRNIYSTRKEKFYVFTAEPAAASASQFIKDLKKVIN